MAQRILARDPREEILRAFELFDEGGKGKINLADLRRVAVSSIEIIAVLHHSKKNLVSFERR